MRFQEQRIKDHNPEIDQIGDCYRTCVAILLGRDALHVPHFSEMAHFSGKGFGLADELCEFWLNEQGYKLLRLMFHAGDGVEDAIKAATGGLPYILTAQSPNFEGVAHCCIAQNGTEVIYDPSCGRARQMEPYYDKDSGVYAWGIEVIVKGI